MNVRLSLCLSLALLMPTLPVSASQYLDTSAGQEFVRDMVSDYGFEAERVAGILEQAERQDAIIESISRPAEKTLEWHSYRGIFMRADRIAQGAAFRAEHADAFERAEREFGVPAEIIAAIIGVETWYGKYRGNYRVLDALATLAFDYPPRSRFFRSELKHYLLMTREQGLDPTKLKGSYAGAMGYGQFISSSYRNFAIDFDDDGVADILNNPVDAIGSVANYFKAHHWKPGAPVADRLDTELPAESPLLTKGLKPTLTVADYREAGLSVPADIAADASARVLRLKGEGEHELWLTYHNFYVITRYNHSHLYAMAVYQLAQALKTDAERSQTQAGG